MSLRRSAAGYRFAETVLGDTVQAVAMRELGDAARWPELVAYNGLAPPYIVDDLSGIEGSGDGGAVLLAGMHIKVPSSRPRNEVADPGDVFGTDLLVDEDGFLSGDGGGFAVVSGLPNLRQALRLRFRTHQKELVWHQEYGNPLFKLVGRVASPVALQLARAYGERTLRSDPRIADVADTASEIDADSATVTAVAIAVDGRPLPVGSGD